MNLIIDPSIHMVFVLLLTLAGMVLFVREQLPLEVTSIMILTVLLLFGQVFPVQDANGQNLLDATAMLSGFANPSLIAVLALLVMGQGMIHTDALRFATNLFITSQKNMVWVSIIGIMLFVMIVSAFLNNTPLVVITIPLIQALAHSLGVSESRYMMPLSYVAILGGMMTLIGSSTNLLVSSAMVELGYAPLGFFDFIIPGSMLAAVGFVYVMVVLPRLLPDRTSMTSEFTSNKKEFVAELDVTEGSRLIGMECVEGRFAELADLNIKLIQRGGHLILPPFEGYRIEESDVLIVSATRSAITEILAKYPGFLLSDEEAEVMSTPKAKDGEEGNAPNTGKAEARVLAEIMITPASRIVDMSLDHVSFHRQFSTIVLGIQRRARVVRRRLGRIRLEPGDTLLIAGRRSVIDSLRDSPDFIVLSGSKRDLPAPAKAPLASAIFLGTIGSAAIGLFSIPVAAITGAVLMIGTGCLNVRQATRAIDRKIFLLVGVMLALGIALQVTGGAAYIADVILNMPFANSPLEMVALLFIIVAICTNVLTNNACAILFTPIAMNLAGSVQVDTPIDYDIAFIFALTVIFAANCSFASPIGYQTNLMVMGPGHYRFRDFVKGGVPLVLLIWLTFIAVAYFYFGLR